MKRIFFLLIIGASIIALGNTNIFACQCASSTPKQRVKTMKKDAAEIFVGVVKTIVENAYEKDGKTYNKIVLTVEKSWKSAENEEITVYIQNAVCSDLFSEGKSYLVYAKTNETNQLYTDSCWGTDETASQAKDLKYLGTPFYTKKI